RINQTSCLRETKNTLSAESVDSLSLSCRLLNGMIRPDASGEEIEHSPRFGALGIVGICLSEEYLPVRGNQEGCGHGQLPLLVTIDELEIDEDSAIELLKFGRKLVSHSKLLCYFVSGVT